MKDNEKIYVNDLYYATLIDENNRIDYVIGTLINGIFTNIKTDEKYIWNGGTLRFHNKTNSFKIYGFKSYGCVDKSSLYGIKTIKEIIEKDKFITKTFNEKTNEYVYCDTQEIQQTLAIIKPDGIKNIAKIIEMIYSSGLKIQKYEVKMLDEEILKEHYSHLLDKPFYPTLESYMLSSEVVIMILEGENAVEKLRNLMGPTDSAKAPKGTIRGEFGTNVTYNAIHGSDSKESAEVEINRFFNQKQKRI